MVELEIDGRKVLAEEGATIIEAADDIGIYIPRFCYHKKLSIAANCRMCLVDVAKVGKPQPACATPVTAGMQVFTTSPKAIDAQRAVLEFLLINHPLDCPICDQGGECELQDLTMGFGRAQSRYDQPKRAVANLNLGPLIDTEMTRCIQCTRCVRFGEEVAGLRELGVMNRGEKEEIGTYIQHFMKSELSGNIIDLCPVGALNNKPARYKGRGFEYTEHPTIPPHDCVGTNMFVHIRRHQYADQRTVLRAVPRENELINETWMSDRDRFGIEGLYHSERVLQPRIKEGKQWSVTSWEEVLPMIASLLMKEAHKHGAHNIAALTSSNSTLEEYYLLQKLCRSLGTPHIDHRIKSQDFSDQDFLPAFPQLGVNIADIPKLNAILLIGSNINAEQPILGHRINQAYENGAKIIAINPIKYPFIFGLEESIVCSSLEIITILAEIAQALAKQSSQTLDIQGDIVPSEQSQRIAATLSAVENSAIIMGEYINHHPEAAKIRAWVELIAQLCKAKIGVLSEGANSAGAWLAGAIPHRGPAGEILKQAGHDAKTLLINHPKKIYLIFNLEIEFDCAYSFSALQTLTQADQVICFTSFVTPLMEEYADFILPITPFTETGGTYVNTEGKWQSFTPASVPEGMSKPGWKVLRVLANLMNLDGFEYKTEQSIRHELKNKVDLMRPLVKKAKSIQEFPLKLEKNLMRFAPWPAVRVDALIRRSQPMQETLTKSIKSIQLHPATAMRLGFKANELITAIQGESRVTLPLYINADLAEDTVFVASGLDETMGFGQAEDMIYLEQNKE